MGAALLLVLSTSKTRLAAFLERITLPALTSTKVDVRGARTCAGLANLLARRQPTRFLAVQDEANPVSLDNAELPDWVRTPRSHLVIQVDFEGPAAPVTSAIRDAWGNEEQEEQQLSTANGNEVDAMLAAIKRLATTTSSQEVLTRILLGAGLGLSLPQDHLRNILSALEDQLLGTPTSDLSFERHQRRLLDEALRRSQGDEHCAARLLGISVEKFRRWIVKHRIAFNNPH